MIFIINSILYIFLLLQESFINGPSVVWIFIFNNSFQKYTSPIFHPSNIRININFGEGSIPSDTSYRIASLCLYQYQPVKNVLLLFHFRSKHPSSLYPFIPGWPRSIRSAECPRTRSHFYVAWRINLMDDNGRRELERRRTWVTKWSDYGVDASEHATDCEGLLRDDKCGLSGRIRS